MKAKIALLFGDGRTEYAARRLISKGYNAIHATCAESAIPAAQSATVTVLPVPCTLDGKTINASAGMCALTLSEAAKAIPDGATVIGGMLAKHFYPLISARPLRCFELTEQPSYKQKNAIPTAEAAISILICATPYTLSGSRITIAGYGCVGEACARMLGALGAHTTVIARSVNALAAAASDGHKTLPMTKENLRSAADGDILINTVPSRIFSDVIPTGRTATYLELASSPYGISQEEAEEIGLKYINAPALPGKYSPQSAGEIIADTVMALISDEN